MNSLFSSGESGAVSLQRDVQAIQIPSGAPTLLPKGAQVTITQSLGGSYTVHASDPGGLYRLRADDADALGLTAEAHAGVEGPYEEAKVWEQLKNCYDPEIPVNIVDLGLVYSVEAADEPDEKGKLVHVKMTLTAPGCGMGPSIAADARQRLLTLPGVADAQVDIVWDPPWSPELISEAGKQKLGMM